MSFDPQWDHQFCLACDKQTDGATYCSESCRLADFEKTSSSSPSSGSSSPGLAGPPPAWTSYPKPAPSGNKFYLSPAYDFSNAQPYGSTPASTHSFSLHERQLRPVGHRTPAGLAAAPERLLSPSSSHSSLSSVRSTATAADGSRLSEKARSELRAYAISFEQVRLQRRRSY